LAALCVLAPGAEAGAQAAENLLRNPGFEETAPFSHAKLVATELPSEWFFNPLGEGKLTVVYDPVASHGGLKFVRVEPTKGVVPMTTARLKTDPGAKHLFSIWAKGQGKLGLSVYCYNQRSAFIPPHLIGETSRSWEIDSDTWQKHEWVFTAPTEANPEGIDEHDLESIVVRRMQPTVNVSAGRIDLDDASLYRLDRGGVPPEDTAAVAAPSPEALIPLITVTRTPAPPVIDGDIGDEAWRHAPVATGFHTLLGALTADDTTFWMTFDDRNLYIAFKSTVPGRPRARVTDSKMEIDVFSDDLVEILMQPDPDKPVVCQFAGNSAGQYFDRLSTENNDYSWNGRWRFANKVEESRELVGGVAAAATSLWTGEIAIAFAELGRAAPKDGELWRVNFCRDWDEAKREHQQRWTSWAPSGGGFHKLERYGFVYFGEGVPTVQVMSLGDLMGGEVRVEGSVLNAASEKAGLLGELLLYLPETGKLIVRRAVPFELAPGRGEKLDIRQPIQLAKPLPLALSFTVTDLGAKRVLYRTSPRFTSLPSFRLASELYYSENLLDIVLDTSRAPGFSSASSVVVEVCPKGRDRPVAAFTVEALTPEVRTATHHLDIAGYAPGDYVVRASVKERGQTVAQTSLEVVIPEKPVWWENRLGISDRPPPPWTPVRTEHNSISVWGREYRFGSGPLPSQVLSNGRPLFASPPALEVVTDKGPVEWGGGDIRYTSRTDTKVSFKTVSGGGVLDLEGEVSIEYDGFARLDLTLVPREKLAIEKLVLHLPLREENALYVKARSLFPSPDYRWFAACLYDGAEGPGGRDTFSLVDRYHLSARGWIWPEQFVHSFFVTGDEAGLCVVFESDEKFRSRKYVQVERAPGVREVLWNIIDSPRPLDGPLTYTLAMQATPVKPLPTDPKRYHYGFMCGEAAEKWQAGEIAVSCGLTWGAGYPQVNSASRWRLKEFRGRGVRFGPYHAPGLMVMQTEEFKLFGKEWETHPRLELAWPFVNTIKHATAAGVALSGSYSDFAVWAVDRLIGEGVTALYFDCGGVVSDMNPHHGSGYTDADGARHATINLFEARETYKRIYTLCKERDPGFFIYNHAAGLTPIAAFVDGCCEGEGWNDMQDDASNLTPDFFRAGMYSYRARGVPFQFFFIKHGTMPRIIPVSVVHNVFFSFAGGGNEQARAVWAVMDGWHTSAEWFPYWKNGEMVEAFGENVRVSLYRKPAEETALLVVANLGREKQAGQLTLKPGLGLDLRSVKAADAQSGKALPLEDSRLDLSLPGFSVRFIQLKGQ